MTPSIQEGLEEIRRRHGADSVLRVERMLLGKRSDRHPLQKQAKWILPGLTSKPWHDPREHEVLRPIVEGLEKLHPEIKAEFLQTSKAGALVDYGHYKGVQDDWKALYLFRKGQEVDAAAQYVPQTFRFMKEQIADWLCPLLEMHFSTLLPGARVAPHCDLWNFTINLHLAVDIPSDCVLRVANVDHCWEEGRCLLFDYSYLHEAWNAGDRARTCLLVDLWNPEVTLAEREALVLVVQELRRLTGEHV
ncbi:aspartyl/asparaginyl beta-hydroxylase domain-containing protein [Roseateles sp. SL47]|uniref:aspartyl/asparaginyl beta-hydroxylase domain-containing protein n=1 Tax=Roseateles sp. SL47 TaxID=2995138 RepID=UPI00226FD7CE|nr:aspartyl/asparaginyl beta-hydroxylase domain-containing protein [Roseateles sp. SL47]WAC73174.1 aspartyl/asparaginyl beta-hydroxylase domain-containing protein [Roseateles sp. SL47]